MNGKYIKYCHNKSVCLSFFLIDNPEMINWDEMSARIFTEMDINEDNKITKEEFIQACLRNNTVSEMLAKKILKVISTDVS